MARTAVNAIGRTAAKAVRRTRQEVHLLNEPPAGTAPHRVRLETLLAGTPHDYRPPVWRGFSAR